MRCVSFALVIGLGLAGCAGSTARTPAVPVAAPVAPAPSPLARIEASTDLDGHIVGALGGEQRATLAIVFASWCVHCRHELGVLEPIVRTEPRLRVIGVNAYEGYADFSDEKGLRAFLAASAPWLRVIHGDDALLAALGGVPKIPSLFLFDAHGALIGDWRRQERLPPTDDELRAAIAAAVGGPAPGSAP